VTLSWTSVFTNETETRANFITNLRTRIDEDAADVVTDNQILEFIRSGLRDINFRTGLLPEFCTGTPDGTEYVLLPSDLHNIEEVLYKSSSGAYNSVNISNDVDAYEDEIDNSRPTRYIRSGQRLYLRGYSQVTTGTIIVYGSRLPTYPAASGNYIDLPAPYIELLYLWCLKWYYTRRRNIDEMNLYNTLYITMCNEVKEIIEREYKRGHTFYGTQP